MGKRSRTSKGVSRTITSLLFAGLLALSVVVLATSVMAAGGDQAGPLKSIVAPTVGAAPTAVKKEEPKEAPKEEPKKEEPAPAATDDAGTGDTASTDTAGGADPSLAPTPASSAMTLTVPKMGKVNEPIGEGIDPATLYNGPGHAPNSGYPWQEGANVYVAGHVLGYSGTGSYMDFAALPSMAEGDEITLTDANGTTYNYVVSEILEVSIYDTWVMGPTGKNQVSLQTCINPPAYDVRLVVRGDLTSVTPA